MELIIQTGRFKITMINTVSALKGKADNMLNQMPNVIREENSKRIVKKVIKIKKMKNWSR